MLSFTKEERSVLLILAAVLFVGSAFHYTLKTYPDLDNIINVMDSHVILHQVDINKASYEELVQISYIGPFTAKKIIERRPFKNIEELKEIKGIKEGNFQKFYKFIKVGN